MIASYLQQAMKDPQSLADGNLPRELLGNLGKKSLAEKLALMESYRLADKDKDLDMGSPIRDRDTIRDRDSIRDRDRDSVNIRDRDRERDRDDGSRDRDYGSRSPSTSSGSSSSYSSSVSDAMDSQEMAETQSRPSFVAYYDPNAAATAAAAVVQPQQQQQQSSHSQFHPQQQQPVYQQPAVGQESLFSHGTRSFNPSRSGPIYNLASEDPLSGSETSSATALVLLPPPAAATNQPPIAVQQSAIHDGKPTIADVSSAGYYVQGPIGSQQQQQPSTATLSSVIPGLKTGAFVTFKSGKT